MRQIIHIYLYNNFDIIYEIILFFLEKKIILNAAQPVNLIYIVTKVTITITSCCNKIFYVDFLKIAEIIKPLNNYKIFIIRTIRF